MKKGGIAVAIVVIVGFIIYYRGKIMRTISGGMPVAPSPDIISYIRSTESYRALPYQDGAGYSIGYGHFLGTGDYDGMIWDRDQAEEHLQQDITAAFNDALKYTDVMLTQGQADALTDFIFNFGAPQFKASHLRELINAGASQSEIATEFKKWVHYNGDVNNGLIARRNYDIQLFNS